MPRLPSLVALVAFAGCAPTAPQTATAPPVGGPSVRTYASQVTDVDAVNTHWVETPAGVVVVDAQRLLPEARRALAHLRASTRSAAFPDGKPVLAVVVTHAHTDHYGGLSVLRDAYPDAAVYADPVTAETMRTDADGFNAARRERHGERFPTQAVISANLPTHTARDGGEVTVDGLRLRFHIVGESEAESHTLVELPDHGVLFTGDLVNVGVPAVPFASVDGWLAQLDAFERRFPDVRALYQGHGPAPADPAAAVPEQRAFLTALRDAVAGALADDGRVTEAETEAIVFALEARWPFYTGVAGNTRREMLAFDVERVAGQLAADAP